MDRRHQIQTMQLEHDKDIVLRRADESVSKMGEKKRKQKEK